MRAQNTSLERALALSIIPRSLGVSIILMQVAFAQAFADIQHIQFIKFRLNSLWWLYNPAKFKFSLQILNKFVQPFVEKAIAQRNAESESRNFTEALSEFTADKKVLRDQLVNTLLAARDTTAATLSWLFYELAYHPEIYAKLRNEVLEVLGNELPTYEKLKNMKYLQSCMNEGIYPLALLTSSAPVSNCTV